MGSSYYSLLDYVFMTLGHNSITAKIDTRIAAATNSVVSMLTVTCLLTAITLQQARFK
ncbi:hypothetical protein V1504DRAFT_458803 [Lipomyces starkeyi]